MSTLETTRRHLLDTLFEAFNRHDGAAVMACMTDDIVFETAAGPDVCGRRLSGTAEVGAAFEGTFAAMPDARWRCTRHTLVEDRGFSEWVFRATVIDGKRIEAEGCDLFVFRGDKICRKSAFRKERPLQPPLATNEAAHR